MKIVCECGIPLTLDKTEGGPEGCYRWRRCVCGRFWGLNKARNVAEPPKIFVGNGQGCGTVWYHTTADARKAVRLNSGLPPHGLQSGLCDQCRCRHGKDKSLPYHACREWKKQWSKLQPPSGHYQPHLL